MAGQYKCAALLSMGMQGGCAQIRATAGECQCACFTPESCHAPRRHAAVAAIKTKVELYSCAFGRHDEQDGWGEAAIERKPTPGLASLSY